MKAIKLTLLLFAGSFISVCANSQNTMINILTQNSGVVNKGATVFVEVSICNTDAIDSVAAYKLRPQISIPVSIASIPTSGHVLPAGWTIISNENGTIRLSNGTDIIPTHTCRTILIAIKGEGVGGPSTISGNLLFSNGNAPGSTPGAATTRDNPADNSSTSTCKTIR